jgi:hypothetical protein
VNTEKSTSPLHAVCATSLAACLGITPVLSQASNANWPKRLNEPPPCEFGPERTGNLVKPYFLHSDSLRVLMSASSGNGNEFPASRRK